MEGWEVQGTRDVVVPERVRRMARMKEEELRRLEGLEKGRAAGVEVQEVAAEA